MADAEPKREIISRKDALARGLKHYFTGKPCAKGHVSKRYVNQRVGDRSIPGKCLQCSLEATSRWRKNNREKTNKINERRRVKYAADPEQIKANARDSFQRRFAKNPQKIRDAAKAWRDKNPERTRAISQNKRARKGSSNGTHTQEDVANIFIMQKGRCGYCRVVLKAYHVDHIMPLSRGGSNSPSNLQLLCAPCNMRKSSLDPIEFSQRIGLLL